MGRGPPTHVLCPLQEEEKAEHTHFLSMKPVLLRLVSRNGLKTMGNSSWMVVVVVSFYPNRDKDRQISMNSRLA